MEITNKSILSKAIKRDSTRNYNVTLNDGDVWLGNAFVCITIYDDNGLDRHISEVILGSKEISQAIVDYIDKNISKQ